MAEAGDGIEEVGTEEEKAGTEAEEEVLAMESQSVTDAKRKGTLRRIAQHRHR
jgi:hypothetical protein